MERIGRYRIIGELGRGAMGVVYHAVDPSIGRSVAIKTIRIRDINDTENREKLRTRLFREARSAGVLSHPNIVTIYDMDEVDGLAYIAMAFVNGPTLEKILGSDQPLSGAVMLRILRQAAAALDYAHAKGIVHRDIKPANVMTDEDGAVKITDFGIAKVTSGGHTETKTISGTPNYMSPEQVQGLGIDGRTDQFSLAVIAYEILTGERPFVGEALGTVVYKIVAEDPAPAHRLNGTLTSHIDGVLRKALSKQPDDRYSSCRDFVQALEKACAESRGWTTVTANTASHSPTVAGVESPVANPPAAAAALLLETEDVPPRVGGEPPRKASLLVPALLSFLLVGGLAALVAYQIGWRPFARIPADQRREAAVASAESSGSGVPSASISSTGVPSATAIDQRNPAGGANGPGDAVLPETESQQTEKGNPLAAGTAQDGALRGALQTDPPLTAKAITDASEPSHLPVPQRREQASGQALAAKPLSSPPAVILEEREALHPSHPAHISVFQDLWVSSNPAGAKAVLDDNFALACQTPCTLKAAAGRHRVMVSLGGFISETREVLVEDTAVDVPPVTLRQANGSVIVMSTPNGAILRVDGRLVEQRTPATISLPPGDHTLSVERQGQTIEKRFDIQAGSLKPWTVNFPQ